MTSVDERKDSATGALVRFGLRIGGKGHTMIIEFPRKSKEIATLANLLVAIERPWIGDMHVPVIAIHIARVRLAVQALSGLLKKRPSQISVNWLLSVSVADLKDMASDLAPTFRREFMKVSRLLIQHAQFRRDREATETQLIGADSRP